jgi:hypothetical protein
LLAVSSQGQQRAKARDITPKPKTLQRHSQDKKRIKIESSSESSPVASSESRRQGYSGYAGTSSFIYDFIIITKLATGRIKDCRWISKKIF